MNNKKILYLEDLVRFCEEQKMYSFSSKETGYKLSVQVPAQFEINTEQNDDSLLFCLVKLMHSGENRNHSSVTDDALIKASKTLAYKPILANFVKYTDPDTNEELIDFTSHDMEITPNGIIYYEGQIGCFTADDPYFEIEDETGHNFLYGYCAIPREYTDATTIIERKNGTKISVELEINEMQYSAKNKVLELTDVNILGATCLGKDPDTLEDIEEGMKNARLDIVDFSQENNSVINYSEENQKINNKLIETLEALTCTLSKFNINQAENSASKHLEEGGNETVKFEELLIKYGKTVDDITFEYENLSDEELEAKFAEIFEEENTDGEGEADPEPTSKGDEGEDNSGDNVEGSDDGEGVKDGENPEVEPESDPEVKPEVDSVVVHESVKPEKYSITMSNGTVKDFALTLDEINYALYSLVNDTYSESDNAWYSVQVYEDGSVVMYDWWNGKAFRQSYKREEDNFSLVGDRVAVKQIWVTDEEEIALNEMKANYSLLEQFKLDTENAQLHSQREAILYNEKYSVLAEKDEENNYKNEAYAKLVSEMDNYSITDLEKELKSVFADYITNGGQFSYAGEPEEKSMVSKKLFATSNNKKPSRYGNLFSK